GVGGCVIWINLDCFLQGCDGLAILLLILKQVAELGVVVGIAGLKLYRLSIGQLGCIKLPQLLERHPKVAVRQAVIWKECNGLPKCLHRLISLSLKKQRTAEIVVEPWQVGPQDDGLAIGCDGVIKTIRIDLRSPKDL